MLTTVAAGRAFDYSYCIGMVAMSGAGFTFPADFAMSPQGMIYVINRAAEGLNQRVSKCTVNHEFLAQFGSPGAGDGQFTWPMSIELDRDENVYVCDEYLQRISVFAPDGKFLHKWGTPGSGDGELNGPSGLAFDRDDNLYIVDSLNSRVQKFTKDGRFLAKWGRHGSGEGEFNMPWGLCLDSQGDVYVADWKNSRVQKFSADGTYLATFAGSAAGVGTIHRPTGVAVDSDRGRLCHRLAQPSAADLQPGRHLHHLAGRGCTTAFPVGAGLYCGQSGYPQGAPPSESGTGVAVWTASRSERRC